LLECICDSYGADETNIIDTRQAQSTSPIRSLVGVTPGCGSTKKQVSGTYASHDG